ncbi:MAG: PIN domain-containing protein [Campylobacterota bacterium]|nr:PIN domain-containing protein [Campylobacterota bacterium]
MSNLKKIRNNYIFIDFENVQPTSFEIPNSYPFKIIIFVGANQTKIPIELATSMQNLGNNAEYIIINGNGKNALDFHITFYLGKLYEKDPEGFFHIISKDTGFDILINHLKEKKVSIYRYSNINEIPIMKQSNFELISIDEQIEIIVDYLIKRGNAKPRKIETLSNTIMSLSGRSLSKNKIDNLINILSQKRLIIITDTKVTYQLKDNNKIPISKQSNFELISIDEQIEIIVDYLIKRGNAKPRKIETLSNTIMSLSGISLSKNKIDNLINILSQKRLIIITDTKVTYQLKDNKALKRNK